MKSNKQLFIAFTILFLMLMSTNSFADTCYDPHYGYFECNPEYSPPDIDQAFVEGAFFGMVIGGFNNDDGYYEHYNNNNRQRWGNQYNGNGQHGGNNPHRVNGGQHRR